MEMYIEGKKRFVAFPSLPLNNFWREVRNSADIVDFCHWGLVSSVPFSFFIQTIPNGFSILVIFFSSTVIYVIKIFLMFLLPVIPSGTQYVVWATFWENFPSREQQNLLCQVVKNYYKFLWKYQITMIVMMYTVSFPRFNIFRNIYFEKEQGF